LIDCLDEEFETLSLLQEDEVSYPNPYLRDIRSLKEFRKVQEPFSCEVVKESFEGRDGRDYGLRVEQRKVIFNFP
jgi:hypothetical protein